MDKEKTNSENQGMTVPGMTTLLWKEKWWLKLHFVTATLFRQEQA